MCVWCETLHSVYIKKKNIPASWSQSDAKNLDVVLDHAQMSECAIMTCKLIWALSDGLFLLNKILDCITIESVIMCLKVPSWCPIISTNGVCITISIGEITQRWWLNPYKCHPCCHVHTGVCAILTHQMSGSSKGSVLWIEVLRTQTKSKCEHDSHCCIERWKLYWKGATNLRTAKSWRSVNKEEIVESRHRKLRPSAVNKACSSKRQQQQWTCHEKATPAATEVLVCWNSSRAMSLSRESDSRRSSSSTKILRQKQQQQQKIVASGTLQLNNNNRSSSSN